MKSEENKKCLRVLVVDDEPITRMIHQHLLEQLNCVVACAEDGEQALKILEKNQFDFALIDFHMPMMDGMELTKAIRRLGLSSYSFPILGVTAETNSLDHEKAKQAGMNDVMVKTTGGDFEEVIKKFISNYTWREYPA